MQVGLKSVLHSKNEAPVLGSFAPVSTETGVVRILATFQDMPKFSHIIQKVSARAFY